MDCVDEHSSANVAVSVVSFHEQIRDWSFRLARRSLLNENFISAETETGSVIHRLGTPKMKIPPLLAVGLALSLSASVPQAYGEEKLEQMLDRSPAPANAMGYVNVAALNDLMTDAGFSSRVVEAVGEYWFVSDLDLNKMAPRWEAGYATLKKPVDAKQLADQVGGYVDTVSDKDVVFSPNETFFVPGDERLGMLRPANRAMLSGWLSEQYNVNVSPYLKDHAKQPEQYLSFMMAVELRDVFSVVSLEEKLNGSAALKFENAGIGGFRLGFDRGHANHHRSTQSG